MRFLQGSPMPIIYFYWVASMEHPDGGIIVLGQNDVFYLAYVGAAWKTLPQRIKTVRSYMTAFFVPDYAVICK